jgi:hypothetical protein
MDVLCPHNRGALVPVAQRPNPSQLGFHSFKFKFKFTGLCQWPQREQWREMPICAHLAGIKPGTQALATITWTPPTAQSWLWTAQLEPQLLS